MGFGVGTLVGDAVCTTPITSSHLSRLHPDAKHAYRSSKSSLHGSSVGEPVGTLEGAFVGMEVGDTVSTTPINSSQSHPDAKHAYRSSKSSLQGSSVGALVGTFEGASRLPLPEPDPGVIIELSN